MSVSNYIPDPGKNPFVRFLTDKKFKWLRHALFIAVGLVFAYSGETAEASERFKTNKAAVNGLFLYDTILLIVIMSLFYLNIYVLIPKLLFRSRIFLFGLCFISIIVCIYLVSWLLDQYFVRPYFPDNAHIPHTQLSFKAFLENGLVLAVLLGCVTGLKVFTKWMKDVTLINQLQQTNLKTELEQLKSQINPHFLFNTLNNLLVLTKTDPDKAAQVLLGLSDLLRYQLYDSARETIQLSKDIDFINNLLALEKIRKDDFDYEIYTEGRLEGIGLPPFLFISFVENAIKHGASTVGHSYLKIKFRLIDKTLVFTSENSKPPVRNNSIGGIGLKNIRRRLELLYPGNHELLISEDQHTYFVTLTIQL